MSKSLQFDAIFCDQLYIFVFDFDASIVDSERHCARDWKYFLNDVRLSVGWMKRYAFSESSRKLLDSRDTNNINITKGETHLWTIKN